MPPTPDFVHVVGEVSVPNPGVDAELTYREPQGINPAILLLDLRLHQRPGFWSQVMTWKPVRYDGVLGPTKYTRAVVFWEEETLVALDVQDIHLSADAAPRSRSADEVPLPRRSVQALSGENPFPWASPRLPVCLSGSVSPGPQMGFCMDGVRHRLAVHPDLHVRVKGATAEVERGLDEAATQRILVTACGRWVLGVEGGCSHLLAARVTPMDRFVSEAL